MQTVLHFSPYLDCKAWFSLELRWEQNTKIGGEGGGRGRLKVSLPSPSEGKCQENRCYSVVQVNWLQEGEPKQFCKLIVLTCGRNNCGLGKTLQPAKISHLEMGLIRATLLIQHNICLSSNTWFYTADKCCLWRLRLLSRAEWTRSVCLWKALEAFQQRCAVQDRWIFILTYRLAEWLLCQPHPVLSVRLSGGLPGTEVPAALSQPTAMQELTFLRWKQCLFLDSAQV